MKLEEFIDRVSNKLPLDDAERERFIAELEPYYPGYAWRLVRDIELNSKVNQPP